MYFYILTTKHQTRSISSTHWSIYNSFFFVSFTTRFIGNGSDAYFCVYVKKFERKRRYSFFINYIKQLAFVFILFNYSVTYLLESTTCVSTLRKFIITGWLIRKLFVNRFEFGKSKYPLSLCYEKIQCVTAWIVFVLWRFSCEPYPNWHHMQNRCDCNQGICLLRPDNGPLRLPAMEHSVGNDWIVSETYYLTLVNLFTYVWRC